MIIFNTSLTKYFQLLVFSIGLCTAQDYDEYRPAEPRSFNSANRYIQAEPEQKAPASAPVAILKQINRHNEGTCMRDIYVVAHEQKLILISCICVCM